MSAITTHVLDTSRGQPAGGVPVVLEIQPAGQDWKMLGTGRTDGDGRLRLLPPESPLAKGTYRLTFDTSTYFGSQGVAGLYPQVVVIFTVEDPSQHYHIPLLLSPYGYSTYRGS